MVERKHKVEVALNDGELQAMHDIAKRKGLNNQGVLRQALRLYQLVDVRGYQKILDFMEDLVLQGGCSSD